MFMAELYDKENPDFNEYEDEYAQEDSNKRFKFESEYDTDDYSYLDDKENISQCTDEMTEDTEEVNTEEFENDEILDELNELDEEDADEENSSKKTKKKKVKEEKVDHSGSAVRERFYSIMNDYHSGNAVKREDALSKAMKELEGFIYLVIKRSYSTYTRKYFADLLQEGYVGIAEGMKKYDPQKSMPTTFFYPYIKHEMQGFITRNVDKTTSHYSSNIKKINKAIQEFEDKGIRYTNVDIAIQTGMTIETVDQSMAIRNYRDEVHIDACPPNIIDNELEENRNKTPEQDLIEAELNTAVHRTVHTMLNEEEIKILCLHFGLDDTTPVSEGEISRRMNMPKDKVKRILNRSIRKLRDSELSSFFTDYVKKEEKFLEDVEAPTIAREATEQDIEFLSRIDDISD